jgi:hypothetical protein
MEFLILSASRLVDDLSRHGFHISGSSSIFDEDSNPFKYWVSGRGGRVVATVTGFHAKKPTTVTYGAVPKELVSIATQYGQVSSGGPLQPKLPPGLKNVSGKALVRGVCWFVYMVLLLLVFVWVALKAAL